MNKLLWCLIISLSSVFSAAAAEKMFFEQLSPTLGLHLNGGTVQDKYGFIWIATVTGLYRYDGSTITNIRAPTGSHILKNTGITCLLYDAGYVWAGTSQGLYRINVDTREIIETLKDYYINTIVKGLDNCLWIGTFSGLVKFREAGTVQVYNKENGLTHNTIRSLYEDMSGNLWIGTYDGLNLLNKNGTIEHFNFKGSYKSELENNLVLTIKPLNRNDDATLLIGTETGLVFFDRIHGTYKTRNCGNSPLSNDVIKAICCTADKIWLGTNFGLNIIDRKTGEISSYFHEASLPYTLSNNVIYDIFQESGGMLWFSTDNGLNYLMDHYGLLKFHNVYYTYDNKNIGKQIRALCATSDKTLYAATNQGIIVVDKNMETNNYDSVNKKLSMLDINDIISDMHDNIWIGTTGGINLLNLKNTKIKLLTTSLFPQLGTNYIGRIKDHTDSCIYACVWESGIFRIKGNGNAYSGLRIDKILDYPTDKFIIDGGKIWFEHYDKFVYAAFGSSSFTEINPVNTILSGRKIESLMMANGYMFIGTENMVIKYKPFTQDITTININAGNTGNVINLIEDAKGNTWGTTENTIFKIWANNYVSTVNLNRNFPIYNLHRNAMIFRDKDIIVCGGDDGFISFNSNELLPKANTSRPFITALEINNRPVNIREKINGLPFLEQEVFNTKKIELSYAYRNLSLNFSTPYYSSTSAIYYRYKLTGFDSGWNYINNRQPRASYPNLPPGKYVFEVQCADNNGQWNTGSATIEIRILPHLLLRPIFLLLYIILAIAVIWWVFRLTTKRIRLSNELKIIKLEKAHSEALTRSKFEFFTNISHEFRTPLSLILPPINEAIDACRRGGQIHALLSIAQINAEKLLRLINQLLDFRTKGEQEALYCHNMDLVKQARLCFDLFHDTASRDEITYTFTSDMNELALNADYEKIDAIIYNLLSNAFKFTPKGGRISLTIKCRQENSGTYYAELTVSDTGIGIDESEQDKIFDMFFRGNNCNNTTTGSGIGLAVVQKYTKLHNGRIELNSSKGQGSTFKVFIPMPGFALPDQSNLPEPIDECIEIHAVSEQVPGGKKPLILYVEDNQQMVDFIKMSLGGKYNILSAPNGQKGYEKCLKFKPCIVISDVMMPEVDGLALCRMIKENPAVRHIPIILLTAKSLPQDQIEGIRTGIDLYLVKPVYPEVLSANIEQIIMRQTQMKDYFEDELLLVKLAGGTALTDRDKTLIDNIVTLIENNLSDPGFNVETLSAALNITPTHLYRRIKKLTGLGTNELIRKYRLKKASILLKNNCNNISEVMYYVGFSSASYFSRCFQKEFGALPRNYREPTPQTQ